MKILDHKQIEQRVKRLAFEIYEQNLNAKKLVFLGINNNGFAFAEMLATMLDSISEINPILGRIRLNPADPTAVEVELEVEIKSLKAKQIILVDDVANTGRTLFYAMKPLMSYLPKQVEVAVLVDRKHKQFPIKVDYVGLSLATTLKENIKVDILKKSNRAAFLQ